MEIQETLRQVNLTPPEIREGLRLGGETPPEIAQAIAEAQERGTSDAMRAYMAGETGERPKCSAPLDPERGPYRDLPFFLSFQLCAGF